MNVWPATGIEEPLVTRLEQNRPNPFNPSTSVAFSLAEPGHVVVRGYDVAGREVRTLVDERWASDRYEVPWDGRDDTGNRVASGVYYYSFEIDGERQTRKMVLLK